LVGHSFGSHIVRLFASQYPQEVVGIILVDGSPEGQREYFQKAMTFRERFVDEAQWQIYRLRPFLARIGILRLRKQPNGYIKALPEEIKPIATAIGLQSKAYDWVWSEAPCIDATNEEVKRSILPDHIQSTILTAGKSIPMEEKQVIWLELQKNLASRMPNCSHTLVEESGHFIHLEKPEKVIEAICQMVIKCRQS
jgi:pimeloyl-ACP methyl ester carboxylesterase